MNENEKFLLFVSKFKSKNKTTYYAIDAIHEGISQRKKITFHYFHYNEKKEKDNAGQGERDQKEAEDIEG